MRWRVEIAGEKEQNKAPELAGRLQGGRSFVRQV